MQNICRSVLDLDLGRYLFAGPGLPGCEPGCFFTEERRAGLSPEGKMG